MAKETLQGDYGAFENITLGSEVSAATTLDADTWYLVTAVDASASAFPAGSEAGYLIRAAGTETLAGTDTAKPLTRTRLCDIQNWNMEFSKSEIDVTTLCDDQKKYLPGKSDVTGTSTGVFKIGITDAVNGIQNQFVDIVQASGTYAINKLNELTVYVFLVTQKDTDAGETEQFYFAPINFTTFGQGATEGEAQTFESGFRIAPDDTNGVKLAYYSYTHS